MSVTGPSSFHHLLLLLFLLFSPSVVFSVRHHHKPKSSPISSTTLDVSSALAKTTQVLTFSSSSSSHQSLLQTSSEPALTLKLHSRDFLHLTPTSHNNYESLTLSRLRRDAARVASLTTRLSLAVAGVSKTDLHVAAADGGGAMEGPVVSGTKQGSGEYFSRISIGDPAKEMFMVLDTGSDITWAQCQPCTDCYQQTDPIFDPASSATYFSVPCNSTMCRALDIAACRADNCLYQVSYGDGSYTVGDFATESVTFGGGGNSAVVPNVAFGCGHDNEGLFVGAAGLLGLGGGPLSFPSQLTATSFSYCLVDRDSSDASTLEFRRKGEEEGGSSETMVTAPMLKNKKMDTFYYVGLTGISVGGQMLSIPTTAFEMDESGRGGVIIDSGTAVTRLDPNVYAALRDAFVAGTAQLPRAGGVALFDTCYDLSSKTTVEVPTVAFHFPGNSELRLPAKNYVIPVNSAGLFCLAFAPTSSAGALSIIGNVQQQGTRVSFDLGNSKVGFATNKC